MLLEFTTHDNSIFVADTSSLHWGRVDKPARDATSQILEKGVLTVQNLSAFGTTYAMSPRTEKSLPGNGVCTLLVKITEYNTDIRIYLGANVDVNVFTMPVPMTSITYHIIPANPAKMEIPDATVRNQEIFERSQKSQNEGTVPAAESQGELFEAEAVPEPTIQLVGTNGNAPIDVSAVEVLNKEDQEYLNFLAPVAVDLPTLPFCKTDYAYPKTFNPDLKADDGPAGFEAHI
jgi:hypothetical protein